MRRLLAGAVLACVLLPTAVAAQSAPVSRRDGFMILWTSIRRAVLENREKSFTDIHEGTKGYEEIRYAKYRGILDDENPEFHPDDPLMLDDALLWLLRTRSVDDIEDLIKENLPALLERYPVASLQEHAVTEEELIQLFVSLDTLLQKEDHEVSLYSEKFHGKGTAFGETFDMHAMTAAHRTFPHNTLVKVTNIRNGKSVTIRVNDRGPFVEGRDMDLSLAAFTAIEDRSRGVMRATFERLGDATIVDRCSTEDPRRAQRITRETRLIGGIPQTLIAGGELILRSTKAFVVRSIQYPDGNGTSVQDWILPGESYVFRPAIPGEYGFQLGTVEGRFRELRMTVVQCEK